MRVLRHVSLVLALSLATAAVAEEFDGSVPLSCEATKGHDCLPEKNQCSRLKPEGDAAPVFGIDFTNKTVRSPFRTALLPVTTTLSTDHALILQGAEKVAWSALINRKTGVMTISVADRNGAYVVFAQCKAATAAAAPPAQE